MNCFIKNVLWLVLCLLSQSAAVGLHPTSCTEDSQCSTEFYCEVGVHFCRQCLSCDVLRRQPPSGSDRDCIKSVEECGDCFDGLIQDHEGLDGQCTLPEESSPHGVLPPYAWAAIAASLVLMIFMLCIFAKMKTFKIAYASRTSVQSMRPIRTAPPPYNDMDNAPAPQSPTPSAAAVEMHHLIGSLSSAPSPESDVLRPRESSAIQTARVCNNPVYERLPQDPPNSLTSDVPVTVLGPQHTTDDYEFNDGGPLTSIQEEEDNNNTTEDHNMTLSNKSRSSTIHSDRASQADNTRLKPELEDSNNNCDEPNDCASSQRRSQNAQYCNNIVTGPSFVINVVENIQNNQQRVDVNNIVP